jgi:hypothetical protein
MRAFPDKISTGIFPKRSLGALSPEKCFHDGIHERHPAFFPSVIPASQPSWLLYFKPSRKTERLLSCQPVICHERLLERLKAGFPDCETSMLQSFSKSCFHEVMKYCLPDYWKACSVAQ